MSRRRPYFTFQLLNVKKDATNADIQAMLELASNTVRWSADIRNAMETLADDLATKFNLIPGTFDPQVYARLHDSLPPGERDALERLRSTTPDLITLRGFVMVLLNGLTVDVMLPTWGNEDREELFRNAWQLLEYLHRETGYLVMDETHHHLRLADDFERTFKLYLNPPGWVQGWLHEIRRLLLEGDR